jgi:hypothetical protein
MLPKLAAVAHGDAVQLTTERKEITVSSDILAKYVGIYAMAPGVTMTITVADGQLISQMSRKGKVPLFAESETMFFPKVVDAEIPLRAGERRSLRRLRATSADSWRLQDQGLARIRPSSTGWSNGSRSITAHNSCSAQGRREAILASITSNVGRLLVGDYSNKASLFSARRIMACAA